MWIGHRKEIRISLQWLIHIINRVDKTKYINHEAIAPPTAPLLELFIQTINSTLIYRQQKRFKELFL